MLRNFYIKYCIAVTTILFAQLSFAANKIAVVDMQVAIESSRHMESIQNKLEQEFGSVESDLKKMANEINAMQELSLIHI